MDMSFTRDPDWIHRREALWKETVKKFDIGNGSPQERVERLHTYFLTGELVEGNPRDVRSRLFYFPAMSIEAIEHVLKYNMPEGADEETLRELKMFFPTPLRQIPGVSVDEALKIFRYVMGDRYNAHWKLPFLLDDEQDFRTSVLDPHHVFECGTSSSRWLADADHPREMWSYLIDYWFSTLPHVDPIVFRPGDKSHRVPGVNLKVVQRKVRKLLGRCAHNVDPTDGAQEGEDRRQFMQDFRERMESLSGPDDLMTLWTTVKATDAEALGLT